MGRMAVEAADVAIGMGRLTEVGLLFGASVTTETPRTRLLAREILETNDLADVAAALNVSGSGSVTVLATVLGFLQKREVTRTFKMLAVDVFMAGLACVGSDVRTGLRIRSTRTLCRLRLLSMDHTDRE